MSTKIFVVSEKSFWRGPRGSLAGSYGEAAGDVVVEMCREKFVELFGDGAGGCGDFVAGNFGNAEERTIGGGDENFVGGEEIFGAERLLDDGDASFGSDFHEDAAGDAFETTGVQRRCENFIFFNGENICGSAFGNFTALVEKNNFVKTFLVGFGERPDIVEPGNGFDSGEGGGGVARMFAKIEARGIFVFGKIGGVDDEIERRKLFVAVPCADFILHEINASAAFGNFIGADDFVDLDADFGSAVEHGEICASGVFF